MYPQVRSERAESHEVIAPEAQTMPLVLASPHSGQDYPDELVRASRLDSLNLRRSEDSFVDEIFDVAPALGAPLLRALFPRAFVDPNREPFELDPAMFADRLPDYVNSRSPRVAAGLGTVARVVGNGASIYRRKLTTEEAQNRLRRCYWPYHRALRELVDQTRQRFGFCILVDCHSMPSGVPEERPGRGHLRRRGAEAMGGMVSPSVQFVIGDCHGSACAPAITDRLENALAEFNYYVTRNSPYAGGFVTRHYGNPGQGVHAVQIEVNRCIYMDEQRFERGADLPLLRNQMGQVISALGSLSMEDLAA